MSLPPLKKEAWLPVPGYEESTIKTDFSSTAGLYKKLSVPLHLEIADPRIQKLYSRVEGKNIVVPFMEMISDHCEFSGPETKKTPRQTLIDRGTAAHSRLQAALNEGFPPLRVILLLLFLTRKLCL
jgi:hypothetical protein